MFRPMGSLTLLRKSVQIYRRLNFDHWKSDTLVNDDDDDDDAYKAQ